MESSLCKIALNFFGSHNFDIQDKNAFEFKHFLMKALGALKNLLNIDSNFFFVAVKVFQLADAFAS